MRGAAVLLAAFALVGCGSSGSSDSTGAGTLPEATARLSQHDFAAVKTLQRYVRQWNTVAGEWVQSYGAHGASDLDLSDTALKGDVKGAHRLERELRRLAQAKNAKVARLVELFPQLA